MTQTNPIHLYRALLREASYLPLAPCRKYIHDFIKQSFHRHHHAPKDDGQQLRYPTLNAILPATHKFSNGKILTLQRQTALLKRGRQFHSLLVRANQGDMKRFEKILRMAYGRVGRRRYELLHEFNSPVPLRPGNKAPPPEYCAPEPREAKRSPHWKPPNQMEALILSQAREQALMPRNKTPKIKEERSSIVTETDIWGKPLSVRRKANQLHKWYLQNTRAVLPPLPAREYAELLAMVTGDTAFPAIPTRRPVGTTTKSLDKRVQPTEVEVDPAIKNTSQLLITGPQWRSSSGIPHPSTGTNTGFGGHPNARARFARGRYMKRRLSRAVLVQTPLAHAAEKATRGIVFSWTDGRPHHMIYKAAVPTLQEGSRQTDLLFG